MRKYNHPHDVILLGISATLCSDPKAEADLLRTQDAAGAYQSTLPSKLCNQILCFSTMVSLY